MDSEYKVNLNKTDILSSTLNQKNDGVLDLDYYMKNLNSKKLKGCNSLFYIEDDGTLKVYSLTGKGTSYIEVPDGNLIYTEISKIIDPKDVVPRMIYFGESGFSLHDLKADFILHEVYNTLSKDFVSFKECYEEALELDINHISHNRKGALDSWV